MRYQDYVAVHEGVLALKPKNLTHEQAAGIPLAGLTALQSLDRADICDVCGTKCWSLCVHQSLSPLKCCVTGPTAALWCMHTINRVTVSSSLPVLAALGPLLSK